MIQGTSSLPGGDVLMSSGDKTYKISHMRNDSTIMDNLLEFSDRAIIEAEESRNVVYYEGWSEAVIGWQYAIADPKYEAHPPVAHTQIKKRKGQKSQDDFHVNYNENSQSEVKDKYHVDGTREWPQHELPIWKANVESETYRYITNNGTYRASKANKERLEAQRLASKQRGEKLTPDQRQFQKEIQRDLKRELENTPEHKKSEMKKATEHSHSIPSGPVPPNIKLDSHAAKENWQIYALMRQNRDITTPLAKGERGIPSDLPQNIEHHVQHPITKPELAQTKLSPKKFYEDTLFSKDAQKRDISEGLESMNSSKKEKIQQEELIGRLELKSESISKVGGPRVNGKSLSEKLIETFSSKISALEDEIKRDSHLFKKSSDDTNPYARGRSDQRSVNRRDTKSDTSIHPRISYSENNSADMFSVKQISSQNPGPVLQPLRKLTPKQRQLQENNIAMSHIKYTTASGQMITIPTFTNEDASLNVPTSVLENIIDMENVRGSQGHPIDVHTSKESLNNALCVSPVRRVSKQIEQSALLASGSKPIHNNQFQPVPIGGSRGNATEPILAKENLSEALLPQISGKRLEVTTVNHRLL
ncbi:unnamed protein product [Owenia fusiformis]|uniref:Uncharacterized protein n=1 Tax=Owenia fusiformis TaxID=6347 RepID=A0A8J1XST8_OWEFU|nr:unnamed protein product [Owenia fusiformis]